MHELVHIPYSAWSMRARWCLDGFGVPWRGTVFVSTLSEPKLRWRLRRPVGRFTLPVLFVDGGPVIEDSVDIALWAQAQGRAGALTPAEPAAVRAIGEVAEGALAAGRVLVTRAVLSDEAALREMLPRPLAGTGRIGPAVARKAARDLLRKYGGDRDEDAVWQGRLRDGLEALRDLATGSGAPLTTVDGVGAVAMAFVAPHAGAPLGPANRRLWHRPALAAEFSDLVAWRDRVIHAVQTGSARGIRV